MAAVDFVEGNGWISDDSDFYGNNKVRLQLERDTVQSMQRPAVFALSQSKAKNLIEQKPSASEQPMGLNDPDDAQDCNSASWQQRSETVVEFLRRAPVSDPRTANLGPWLWVYCPKSMANSKQRFQIGNEVSFMRMGQELIKSYDAQQANVEASNHEKAPGMIARNMNSHRKRLEEDIITLAVKSGMTCGKWMLFPNKSELPRCWQAVAEATSQGRLGPACKVATPNPLSGKVDTLICVYTYDFTDEADVRRVLNELLELKLGPCRVDSRPIYYKCDAYTHLEIESGNRFKIRASLWSSDEVLGKNGKKMVYCPVARVQKKTGRC